MNRIIAAIRKKRKTPYLWWRCPGCESEQHMYDLKDGQEPVNTHYGPCTNCGWQGNYHQLAKSEVTGRIAC
jgi:ribosomal protein S27E